MSLTIESLPDLKVLAVRHTGPYEECHPAWKKLFVWAGKKGLIGSGTLFVGVSYDDPQAVPAEKLRYDACITLTQDVTPEGDDFRADTIPGGDYAVYTHVGPYGKMAESYQKMFHDLIPPTGREVGDAGCLEIYLNDPEETPEEELQTKLCVPLK